MRGRLCVCPPQYSEPLAAIEIDLGRWWLEQEE